MRLRPESFPITASAQEVLDLYNAYGRCDAFHICAKNWRVDVPPGEDEWFEEITSDELEDECFVEHFEEAIFIVDLQSE